MHAIANLPQWTEAVYPAKPGLDHLGVGSVTSAQILTALSPGINVQTVHPRYHSFYVFLLDEFWKRKLPRSAAAWKAFFRPREFIFSLGASLAAHAEERREHVRTTGIVGSTRTSALASERRTAYTTTEEYIQSPLGGFGLYYRSVMAELGLIYPGGAGFDYQVDVPTDQGKEIAESFRHAVRHTTYYTTYFHSDRDTVPLEAALEFANAACVCQLRRSGTPDRQPLLHAFLHGGREERASARRSSIRLLLDIADQTNGHSIDADAFRKLLYYQATEAGVAYVPSPDITTTYRSWRLFQAREYYNFALNVIWRSVCDWGYRNQGDAHPIPEQELTRYVTRQLSLDVLAEKLGLAATSLTHESSLASVLTWIARVVGPAPLDLSQPIDLQQPLHEHRLYKDAVAAHRDVVSSFVGMIVLLLLLFHRFQDRTFPTDPSWFVARMGYDGRLPMDGRPAAFLPAIRAQLRANATFGGAVTWLVSEYIVRQHQLVASQKLPENTYRFHHEGPALRFYVWENPIAFRDSRFNALSTTIHELGLCGNLASPEHPLTSDGVAVLERGAIY